MPAHKWTNLIQVGAAGAEDRQIQQDDPGQQTEGQTEGEASAPAGAGDWLSRCASLTVCCAAASRPAAPAHPRDLENAPNCLDLGAGAPTRDEGAGDGGTGPTKRHHDSRHGKIQMYGQQASVIRSP
jgi:hypothetical protein